ncbi:hypothetical protein Rmf_13860 [Roseomonas fluvialis]|uniref:Uncharacterized protein n=1 Tax=Roseomonas fluvialis TaxID=1750527 RepID=A0ABN6P0U8_9PROT|nr:hypothetical protein Rmf_13860 [Roseomonas fluvialis]
MSVSDKWSGEARVSVSDKGAGDAAGACGPEDGLGGRMRSFKERQAAEAD